MIYVAHGILHGASRSNFAHRNMVSRERFRTYLQSRNTPFRDLDEAVRDRQADALTIDDGTYAAADMAVEARSLGHEVTIFVNPSYIERPRPYYFHLLTLLMIQMAHSASLQGQAGVPLGRMNGIRGKIKRRILQLQNDDLRINYIADMFNGLNLTIPTLPRFMQTISREDVKRLVSLGVRIENHGWEHPHFSSLSRDERIEQIEKGREWCKDISGDFGNRFAVPFGDYEPNKELRSISGEWFGVRGFVENGLVADWINRSSLIL